MPDRRYRIGADIGGTFTDVVIGLSNGSSIRRKVLSTPDDYARGIVEAVSHLLLEHGLDPEACDEIVHGTTVATNAILENKGVRTGLITTRGFRDVLELRRLRVPMLYNLRFRPPTPIVERRLRLEVDERVDPNGETLKPLDERSVTEAITRLRDEGVEAVAVSLLHSYRSAEHERRVGAMLQEELPEAFLSLSVDVLPEIREYERTSTTVINAYVGPVVRRYLESLSGGLAAAGVHARLTIMQSNGGVMSATAAASKPAAIVESGPAAGVIASQHVGARSGIANVITFDMGGTTAKASLIEGGEVSLTTEYEVGSGISHSSRLLKGGGHALKLPVLDIAEVGAGGGSIVWIDRGGALKVGPQSAGAVPGPACYGRGGDLPTVTDANLVLGYLNPGSLAGGALTLDAGAARSSLAAVASHLNMGVEDAALGVHAVADASMIRAIKAVSTYRGRDPREFTLLAFGGSGPLHAAGIARALGIGRVIVPPMPGVFSAVGLLQAVPEHHFVQTIARDTAAIELDMVSSIFSSLEERACSALAGEGHADVSVSLHRQADMRYAGQAYELTVPVERGEVSRESLSALVDRFGQEHERVYGHRADDEPVELVNLRVTARAVSGGAQSFTSLEPEARRTERQAYFDGRFYPTPVVSRAEIESDGLIGPAVIEDYDATTVVPPGNHARLDEWGSIVIEVKGS